MTILLIKQVKGLLMCCKRVMERKWRKKISQPLGIWGLSLKFALKNTAPSSFFGFKLWTKNPVETVAALLPFGKNENKNKSFQQTIC